MAAAVLLSGSRPPFGGSNGLASGSSSGAGASGSSSRPLRQRSTPRRPPSHAAAAAAAAAATAAAATAAPAAPADFVEHLLRLTAALVDARPAETPRKSNGIAEQLGALSIRPGGEEAKEDAAPAEEDGDAAPSAELYPLALPLPTFAAPTADDEQRTQAIEAHIATLVARLWAAEDELASRDAAAAASSASGSQSKPRAASDDESPSDTRAGGAPYSLPNFPYPLSHAHPQSSTYPLSYPLGMSRHGPVLLTPSPSNAPAAPPRDGELAGEDEAKGALGAFERYIDNDESGLSAQEELRLLKAQVQDIARVCKVSRAREIRGRAWRAALLARAQDLRVG